MKRLWLLVLVLVSVNSLGSQEVKHAPTVDQCRADQQLWLSKIEDFTSSQSVGYELATGWGFVMEGCEKIDPDHLDRYYNTEVEIAVLRVTRLYRFLERHNMYQQFLAEDAQGKR
jgi:hypothetical protein